jgi:adenylosuccinate lyase
MRHLQRSEIAEVRERFEAGQTGSSTMAHKRNPLNFENVVSMSKQVTAQTLNANLNLSSEHQRDLTDSASSRFYTISVASVASMAARLNKIMGKLEVDEEAMARNLHLTGGAIAAEPFYLLLAKHNHPQAHEASKEVAHRALEQQERLADTIAADLSVSPYWERFSKQERQIIINPEKHYSGLAARKAKHIAKQWRKVLA